MIVFIDLMLDVFAASFEFVYVVFFFFALPTVSNDSGDHKLRCISYRHSYPLIITVGRLSPEERRSHFYMLESSCVVSRSALSTLE